DMSVGYDLAGIKSEPVDAFIEGMKDCSSVVESLRKQIPDEFSQFRDLDFNTCLSDSLTLSTFHGCPPDEIEKIMEYLLVEKGLHAIVKLNPTLLGPDAARTLLNDTLGYSDIRIPDSAFANDTKWEQAVGFVERLGKLAKTQGKGFGVKFSNTLLVDNHKDFFPAEEKSMYLSGAPLHVFAMTLVAKFREHFGDTFPISFSAGIDRNNFADAVAIGLTPVTVCSDLLKPGGYARASGYLDVLGKRMAKVSATSVGDFILLAYGQANSTLAALGADDETAAACQASLGAGRGMQATAGELYPAWLSATKLANTKHYVEQCIADPRYRQPKNHKTPKKVGTALALFDCVSCNKCIPVCPNDANFSYAIPEQETAIVKMTLSDGKWQSREEGTLRVEKKVQYGNFADFCNECGNCDIFCPEDGGPYAVKGRFFGNLDDWRTMKSSDGFFFERGDSTRIYGRFEGNEFEMQEVDGKVSYRGQGFEVTFDSANPAESVAGNAETEVDLSYYYLMSWISTAVLNSASANYLRYL
ncbi:MAG: glutamate synthase, partial [Kofleriaceae bacterium]|nr:glutamate synthase [Kofleriaceae bacterium]